MDLVVLTTDTLHHKYFIKKLAEVFSLKMVISETVRPRPPFETAHPFEAQREEYERQEFFNGRPPVFSDCAPFQEVVSINDEQTFKLLKSLRPMVTVVFGTGRISPEIIKIAGEIVNLHGGDPERYRGLDSHLWAIYHNDYSALVTCLHKVNPRLDDGEIILRSPLSLEANLKLHQLRKNNTEVCLKLVLAALAGYRQLGDFLAVGQKRIGRYYSFMPSCLKEVCRRKFEKYTANL